MCATYQLAFEDIKEIKEIADKITEKYGSAEAKRCFSSDFFPKSTAPVIGPENKVALLKWGFPMKGISRVIFNARSENLESKSIYKTALEHRCLVPVTSFYEWDKDKTKYKIFIETAKLFYLAGLWKEYLISGSKVFCYTIITTEPNEQMKKIHNRMPAILTPEQSPLWVGGSTKDALRLLKPFDEELVFQTV